MIIIDKKEFIMKIDTEQEELLTVGEVAKLAKVKKLAVYRWIHKGLLDYYQSETGFIRIPKDSLLKFLDRENKQMAE